MTLTQCIDGLMGSSTNAAPRPRFDDSMFDVLSGIRLFPAHRGIFGLRRKALPDTNRSASVALRRIPMRSLIPATHVQVQRPTPSGEQWRYVRWIARHDHPTSRPQAFHGFSHGYLSRLPIIVLPAGVMCLAAGGN